MYSYVVVVLVVSGVTCWDVRATLIYEDPHELPIEYITNVICCRIGAYGMMWTVSCMYFCDRSSNDATLLCSPLSIPHPQSHTIICPDTQQKCSQCCGVYIAQACKRFRTITRSLNDYITSDRVVSIALLYLQYASVCVCAHHKLKWIHTPQLYVRLGTHTRCFCVPPPTRERTCLI